MTDRLHSGLDRRSVLGSLGLGGAMAAVGTPTIVLAQAEAPPMPREDDGTLPKPREDTLPPASSGAAAEAVEAVRDAILRISREVWATPELSLAEVKSHRIHLRELEAAGFTTKSRGTSGIPTAFISEWSQGSGGPIIGYLPEYDALPGLGNAAEPRQTPGATGAEVGHGCGHNMLGAGCTGGALALKRLMQADGTPGTIRVYGCAAEETEGAKVYMARDGLFEDLDAAIAWHSAPFAGAGNVRLAAFNQIQVRFHGRTGHAGSAPWEGRSALKAAEMFGVGIQMMREHILPTSRMHYIYQAAGVAPNIVPDFAQVWIVARDADREKLGALSKWIGEVAEAAAMATQTRAEFEIFFGSHDLLPNEPLARHLYRHMLAVPIEFTDDEQAFARACQREMGVPEAGMSTRPLPFIEDVSAGASSDLGDVSYQVPTGVFAWPTIPLGIGLHTWPVTACGGMSIGDKGSLATARILAACGHDLMTDAGLRKAAREDFRARRGDAPFVSPLPKDRTAPLGLDPHFIKTGDDELFADITVGTPG
ncbi:aminobenzoyl-glutamate utilization protein B [Amaricoccus macauensis]|uniref:Aminobenzoyl-glutamate utilization protein B n=1 Tax=Amaricoccus macauensis TaxID=57001 RepID=A0A840SQX6_9RHOB|nr:amidohydrolase [Amaricoccus macauensis]MBB5222888.1 aminobenzoyl-glutamate utilization protein B [Amaricoccus macauensis]